MIEPVSLTQIDRSNLSKGHRSHGQVLSASLAELAQHLQRCVLSAFQVTLVGAAIDAFLSAWQL
jgi:hypothetical protein